jgi:hypothetical protein
MVEDLCYKPGSNLNENIEFFSMYVVSPVALGPGVYSASNRNEY